MKKRSIIICSLLCLLAFATANSRAQTIRDTLKQVRDTVFIPSKSKSNDSRALPHVFKPNPATAVKFAIVPGMGQMYNRKYWKLPIVYGGFLGLGYAIAWNNSYYTEYKAAYRDIIDTDDNTNSFVNFIPPGYTAETVDKLWLTSVLNQKKDSYRRYRDMTIIGTVAFYGLTMIDAFVDAQLYDFDISPDLSIRVEPLLIENKYENIGTLGIRFQVNF